MRKLIKLPEVASNAVVHLELHTGDLPEARALYAQLLEPRGGPAGWRSVVVHPSGGEIAFWQPKCRESMRGIA